MPDPERYKILLAADGRAQVRFDCNRGSGTFYFVAAAIAANATCRGTNAVLLGNRVSPRTIRIRNGVIVGEFVDRNPDQPMAAAPSIGKTIYLKPNEGYLTAAEPLNVMRIEQTTP